MKRKTLPEIFEEKGLHKWFCEKITDKYAVINNLPLKIKK